MIRVILKGRLGNNLFQYAVGRALSKKLGVPLILDASRLKEKVWKDSSLLVLLPLKAALMRKLPFGDWLARKINIKRLTFRKMNVVREGGDDRFQSDVLESPDNTILIGFFQTSLYFDSIADDLRKEINLSHISWPAASLGFAELLSTTNSVAVHVRRTDYLGNSEWNVCSLEYYLEAMSRMRNIQKSPRFFIFSDDPDWCRKQFNDVDHTIVDFPEMRANPLHDLFLMSTARHHIIANSSYSWWGAWLGKKPGQVVFIPPRWTNESGRHAIEEKLVPGWETISVTPGQA